MRSARSSPTASGGPPSPAAFGEGLYSAEWNEQTYAECLRRAEDVLFEGGPRADRCELPRRGAPPALPRRRPPLGCDRLPDPLPGRRRSRPRSIWTVAGTMPPTPTGRSTRKPPGDGKSPGRGRCRWLARSTREETCHDRLTRRSMSCENSAFSPMKAEPSSRPSIRRARRFRTRAS